MPVIPTFENTIGVPTAPGPPRVGIDQFAASGAALEGAGAAVSEQGQRWLSVYADAKRQADASSLAADGMAQLSDKRFQWSHTDDSHAAYDGYRQDAAGIIKSTIGRSADPLVQQYVQRALTTQSIVDAENTRQAAFGIESSKVVGQLDTTLTNYAQQAALAPDDLTRAHYVDLAHQAIAGAAAGHWLAPQAAADRGIQFTSQIAEVKARRLMATDPVGAAHVLQDPRLTAEEFPGLLPEKGAALAGEAVWRAMRVESRNAAAQAHADAVATRTYHAMQQSNETSVLSDVYDGKPVDMGQVTDAARKGLISPAGLNTIHSAMLQGAQGQDDTNAVLNLQDRLNHGELTPADIHGAVDARKIKGTTALTLMKAIGEQGKQSESALDRSNFAALRTSVGVDATGQSLFSFNKGADKAAQQQKWAQAQMEWTQRVLIQHQDSSAVLHDMAQRYGEPPQQLDALPRPLLGPITDQKSLQAVAVQTFQAFQQHRIDQGAYDREVALLNQYRSLLQTTAQQPRPGAPGRSAPAAAPRRPLTPMGVEGLQ